MSETWETMVARDATEVLAEWFRKTGTPEDPTATSTRINWLTADTFRLEDEYGTPATGAAERYRVTVIVEPAESWRQGTWAEVAELRKADPHAQVRVRLGEAEATVVSAVTQRWHVDPRSPERYPRPLEHDVVAVKLAERGNTLFQMPPHGVVFILTDEPVGPALAATVHAGLWRTGEAAE
jgi:hypothetical protein